VSLSIGKSEVEKDPWLSSILVVCGWTLWIAVFSSATSFEMLRVPLTGVVLIWAARFWTWTWAGLAFVLMSWIYHQWSEIPPGLFALSCFFTFLVLRLFISQIEIQSLASYSICLALGFLSLEVSQWISLGWILPDPVFNWSTLLWVLVSVVIQFCIGLLFYRPLRTSSA